MFASSQSRIPLYFLSQPPTLLYNSHCFRGTRVTPPHFIPSIHYLLHHWFKRHQSQLNYQFHPLLTISSRGPRVIPHTPYSISTTNFILCLPLVPEEPDSYLPHHCLFPPPALVCTYHWFQRPQSYCSHFILYLHQ